MAKACNKWVRLFVIRELFATADAGQLTLPITRDPLDTDFQRQLDLRLDFNEVKYRYSPREQWLMELMMEGHKLWEAAKIMGVSVATVNRTMQSILDTGNLMA